MQAVDLIQKKRDGKRLSRTELSYLVEGYVAGRIPDYQMAAFSMAVYFQGMQPQEIADLTMIMAHSGDVLDLAKVPGIKVDKHSTGGVGDTTTLIIAPLVASAGVPIAKMSGRSLGHTGGTVDKLESIPNYRLELSAQEFIAQIERIGLSIVAQTGKLAPADKLLYALRDVTATVESVPMIASSIMSKKIAAGADRFVLDVKVGQGAFMKTVDAAVGLARTMVQIGVLANKETVAFVTDMNQPLGRAIGNALEVKEAILALAGAGPDRLSALCLELSAEMLLLAGVTTERERARELLEKKLRNKEALRKLGQLIEAQGGDPRVIDDFSLLPQARYKKSIVAPTKGYIKTVEPLRLGMAAMGLGAGRQTKEAAIDLAVGLELTKQIGDPVLPGEKIAVIHANDEQLLKRAIPQVQGAFTYSPEKIQDPPLIYRRITAEDV